MSLLRSDEQKETIRFHLRHSLSGIAGVVLVAVAAIAYFAYFARERGLAPAARKDAITSIAVLPFVNASNNPDAEYLSSLMQQW